MAASYPGTIKTFSTKASGEAIASSHINDLQNEVVAVETTLGANAGVWKSWTPTITWEGGTTDPTAHSLIYARYVTVGKLVFIYLKVDITTLGTSDRTTLRATLPTTLANAAPGSARGNILSSSYVAFDAATSITGPTILVVFNGNPITKIGSIFASAFYERSSEEL